jgi:hypothetical protein
MRVRWRALFLAALAVGLVCATCAPGFGEEPDTRGGPVTAADLATITPAGLTGLDALMADHPELLTLIHRDDEIWQWLAVHFSNRGRPVQWTRNSGVRFQHYLAMSSYTHPVLYLASRTPGGNPVSPQLQLSELVYELLNISHEDEFQAVCALARAGKLTEDQFVEAMARVEFRTCQETDAFHRLVWLPYADKNHLPLYRGNWHIGIGDDFNRWLDYHRRIAKDGYPDDAYRPTYERLAPK